MKPQKDAIAQIENQEGLHWKQRPEEIQQSIDDAYSKLNYNTSSEWDYYNGSTLYDLGGISDYLVIEKILLRQLGQGQTRFVFIDIGAGNFQWGRNIAKFINKHPLFKKCRIKVSIYSIRGECSLYDPVNEQGICTLYEYGNFKVENLVEEFDKLGHDLANQVDLIVSSWCFRHLVDPTGTLLQAYELLKPATGMIFLDGFFLQTPKEPCQTHHYSNIMRLFSSFQTPFFMMQDNSSCRLNCFVMQKSKTPCHIPLKYEHGISNAYGYQIGSHHVTVFKPAIEWEKDIVLKRYEIDHRDYYTTSPASEPLLRKVILDHYDIKLVKYNAFINILKQINNISNESNESRSECYNDIYRLLEGLIELDQDCALICINKLLELNRQEALRILNYIPEHGNSFFMSSICSYCPSQDDVDVPPLFKKLFDVASADVLNAKRILFGTTALMHAVRHGYRTIITLLLSSPNIDLTVRSDRGKTALGIAQEETKNIREEIKGIEENIDQIQRSSKGNEAILKQHNVEQSVVSKTNLELTRLQQFIERVTTRKVKKLVKLARAQEIESLLKAATIKQQQQSDVPELNATPSFASHCQENNSGDFAASPRNMKGLKVPAASMILKWICDTGNTMHYQTIYRESFENYLITNEHYL